MSLEQTEDLKAYERRLTEVIAQLQPSTTRWRLMLIIVSACTAIGSWNWAWDPETTASVYALGNHPFFCISCFLLILLFFGGVHKRVIAPSIIASRCRLVLADYNMSCDDTGKLILKPRPTT